MKVEALPPVPCPPGHYWRQFRVRVLPGLGVLVVLAVTVWLWGKNLSNPLVVGQAESLQADVASPKPGRIAKLNIKLFQEVKAGDALAIIETAEPLLASNTIAKILAEMNLIRASTGLDAGERIRLADFRLGWMIRRAELAVAQARFKWAESEFDRVNLLAAEKFPSQINLNVPQPDLMPQYYTLASSADLDAARRDRDEAAADVEQLTLAVAAAEKALRDLDRTAADPETGVLKATLAVAEQDLRLAEAKLAPVILTSPIAGRVSKLDLQVGSVVAAGIPIIAISGANPDRITGFLSQPLRIEPKIGMKIEVRSRGLVRRTGVAHIVDIGPRIVLFDAPLRVRGMGVGQERGLPFVMDVPANMFLRPGELVDLRLVVN